MRLIFVFLMSLAISAMAGIFSPGTSSGGGSAAVATNAPDGTVLSASTWLQTAPTANNTVTTTNLLHVTGTHAEIQLDELDNNAIQLFWYGQNSLFRITSPNSSYTTLYSLDPFTGNQYMKGTLTVTNVVGSASTLQNMNLASAMKSLAPTPAFVRLNTVFENTANIVNETNVLNLENWAGNIKLGASGNVYFELDGFYVTSNALVGGTFVPNPTNFPNGFYQLVTNAHANGLKFAMHSFADGGGNVADGWNLYSLYPDNNVAVFASLGIDMLTLDSVPGGSALDDKLNQYTASILRHGRPMLFVEYDPRLSQGSRALMDSHISVLSVQTNYPLSESTSVANCLISGQNTTYSTTNGAQQYLGPLQWEQAYTQHKVPGNYIFNGTSGDFDTNTFKCTVNVSLLMSDPLQVVKLYALTNDLTSTNMIYLTNILTSGSLANKVWNDTTTFPDGHVGAIPTWSNNWQCIYSRPLKDGGSLAGLVDLGTVNPAGINISVTNTFLQSNVWYVAQNLDPRHVWTTNWENQVTLPIFGGISNTIDCWAISPISTMTVMATNTPITVFGHVTNGIVTWTTNPNP